jgi:hypothetical protein
LASTFIASGTVHNAHAQQRPSSGTPLVVGDLVGNEQTDPDAQRHTGNGYQD